MIQEKRLSRRSMLAAAAATGTLATTGTARAQARKTVLVIGLDISDGRNYDPARSAETAAARPEAPLPITSTSYRAGGVIGRSVPRLVIRCITETYYNGVRSTGTRASTGRPLGALPGLR